MKGPCLFAIGAVVVVLGSSILHADFVQISGGSFSAGDSYTPGGPSESLSATWTSTDNSGFTGSFGSASGYALLSPTSTDLDLQAANNGGSFLGNTQGASFSLDASDGASFSYVPETYPPPLYYQYLRSEINITITGFVASGNSVFFEGGAASGLQNPVNFSETVTTPGPFSYSIDVSGAWGAYSQQAFVADIGFNSVIENLTNAPTTGSFVSMDPTVSLFATPEPSSVVLLGLGAIGLGAMALHRKNAKARRA